MRQKNQKHRLDGLKDSTDSELAKQKSVSSVQSNKSVLQTEEIRPGYKLTKLGWIPEDWSIQRLSDLAQKERPISYGIVQTGEPVENGIRCVRVTDIVDGRIDLESLITTSKKISDGYKRTLLRENDLVIALRGKIGEVAKVDDKIAGSNLTRGVALIAPKDIETDFLKYQLSSPHAKRILELNLNGSALQELSIGVLRRISVIVANSFEEQKAIAQVLSTWDKAISTLTQLITEKQQKKKALMQQLLTGKKRFLGFDGEWKEVKLGDVFERIRETGEDIDDESEAYTISSKLGFVTQHQKFDRVIAGSSLKKYTLIRRDEFSYNKGNSKTFPYGCIFKFEQDHGLIPFVYISFRSTGEVSIDFYKHYFFFGMLERQLKKIITSGARGDGLLNVNPDSFFKLMIDLPPLNEQKKIAEVLNAASKEIELLNQKLDALKDQKKGLMQQLLTGKKRIKY